MSMPEPAESCCTVSGPSAGRRCGSTGWLARSRPTVDLAREPAFAELADQAVEAPGLLDRTRQAGQWRPGRPQPRYPQVRGELREVVHW